MSSALGQVLVLGAVGAAGFTAALGLWSALRGDARFAGLVRVMAALFAGCTLLATSVLWRALFAHDLSLRYVAKVGSLSAPPAVTFGALWAGYEGSLLFFCAVLAAWVVGLLAFGRLTPEAGCAVLGVAGATAATLLLPLAGPSSPFVTLSPAPADGQGVAPLLQDHWLMLLHPPLLYGGQLGLVVPFALALLALARGRLAAPWRRAMRGAALWAWALLTAGLVLGAWWAYAVLGWGGFWAWDPVENAALVPWLFATALLHALHAAERERRLERLAVALAVAAFETALLGGFVTRSGAIDSVHAFSRASGASVFLVVPGAGLAAALVLVARRRWPAPAWPWRLSRGAALLLGVAVLGGLGLFVLVGTATPLLTAAATGAQVAVARPYYDGAAVPAALAALLLLGIAPALPWRASTPGEALRALRAPAAAGAVVALACLSAGLRQAGATAAFALAAFAAASGARGASRSARSAGAWLCHLGVLVAVTGIAGASALAVRAEADVLPGETFAVGRARVRYLGLVTRDDGYRRRVVAALAIGDRVYDGAGGARLTFYGGREQPVSGPLVVAGFARDVYVSLAGFDPESKRAAFTAWEFPLMSWLWAALVPLLAGAALAVRGAAARLR
ncbi:MAG: cytochrome c biogenesis protein CcsA [Myxococcaceae bacterium]|nr:cytochrome c biogenesis protein CcsA [Myxococcaceae bacterium]